MPVSPTPDNAPWGFVEWAITGLSTILASVGAFVWRLMLRLETIEHSLARQRQDIDATRQAGEAALLRLADRVCQLHDDHYRLRETIGALPTRADLRDLDEHIGERLDALAARLDRVLEFLTALVGALAPAVQSRAQFPGDARGAAVLQRNDADLRFGDAFAAAKNELSELDHRAANSARGAFRRADRSSMTAGARYSISSQRTAKTRPCSPARAPCSKPSARSHSVRPRSMKRK